MLGLGIIRPFKSLWASPLHMIFKPTGDWRPCGDYKALKRVTLPDMYPSPHIKKLCVAVQSQDLQPHRFHSSIQSNLRRRERHAKNAVPIPFGLFEFVGMPFGLSSVAQNLQRFIHKVTRELKNAYVYLDNILVTRHSGSNTLRTCVLCSTASTKMA